MTDKVLMALHPEAFTELARALSETLKSREVGAEAICRAVLGDSYAEEQVESYEAGDWE